MTTTPGERGDQLEAMRWLARQLRWERTLDALRQQVEAAPAPLRATPEPRAA